MEWEDFNVRAGLRLDYFDARSSVPSDLSNPANSIQGAPESVPVDTSPKSAVSPRLGVSYPIEDWASLHFAYGHFRQFPAIGQIFTNANYDVLANLQSGGVDYGVLGNPDVSPERTVQYEFGYKHILNEDMGLDVTTFYKDIRDLLGVEFIETYNGAEYARLTNVDLGDVIGITAAFDARRIGRATLALDYTWQQALGNSSDPRETATRAAAGEDPQPRIVPFVWDQRHTFNLTATIDLPNAYSASAILRAASGQPYTPVIDSGFNNGLETNSGRKPVGFMLDLRAEKSFGNRFGPHVSVFARAFNLFDARFFNGFVFNSTGSPYYSRFTEADRVTLADPNRYFPPRRLEIGITLGGEES
jgi:outer membrane receptor protein involved in Fe transport